MLESDSFYYLFFKTASCNDRRVFSFPSYLCAFMYVCIYVCYGQTSQMKASILLTQIKSKSNVKYIQTYVCVCECT